ncbi:MAG TPA: double zinc ribbon domain-containing protein [Blastocatellia bacterium]|nr:double zinc ribbon domain-containing protein [Blastocatellia bacterium]
MLTRALKSIRDGLLSLAYPQQCRMCGNPVRSWDDGVACRECWEDPGITSLFFDLPSCRKCGRPFGIQSALGLPSSNELSCIDCSGQLFEAARSCGAYSGALEASIIFLKSEPHVCPRLREILFRAYLINRPVIESELVVAVPLHRLRQRERGFNQATIIARLIASRFDLAFDDSSLARVAHTSRHRAGIDAIDRAKSVEGAFKVTRPKKVSGLSVLLIDDLFTTGSTIAAATKDLLDAGAARVRVLTIARAVRTGP